MPIYEYVCSTCGKEFEAIQKFSDAALTECTCGEAGQVQRKLSLSAFQLKGSGWYKDLYGSGNGKKAAQGDGAKGDDAKKDAAKPEAGGKSDGKTGSESKASDSGKKTGATSATPSETA